MIQKSKATKYIMIPDVIAHDSNLCAGAKLLYGEILVLCNKKGFCWAENEYFARQYQNDPKTISRWLQNLETYSYIEISTMYEDDMSKKGQRCIAISKLKPRTKMSDSEDKNVCETDKSVPKHGQKCPKTRTEMSQNTDKNVQSYTLYSKQESKQVSLQEREREKTYGFFKNISLTPEEYENLKHDFPAICDQIIEELSGYMQSQNKTYEDHAAAVRLWCSRKADELKNKASIRTQKGKINTPASYDINSIEEESFTETLNFGGAG